MSEGLFADILGHERVKTGLTQAMASGRVHHALLFSGRQGIGKRALAIHVAQILNCEHTTLGAGFEGLRRCGTCRHCRRLALEQHPDLHILRPDKRFIKIQQIRDLQHTVSFHAFEARYRVVLIEDAHTMRNEAANALLKTLEEPLEGTVFILLTDQVHRLLPTIISRCQGVRFAPFEIDTVRTFLLERGHSDARARLISVLAEGSLGRALSYAEDEGFDALLADVEHLPRVLKRGPAAALEVAAEMARHRAELATRLAILRAYLRDLILVRAGVEVSRLGFAQQHDVLNDIATRLSHQHLQHIMRAITQAEQAMDGNVQPLLALEAMWLDVATLRARRRSVPA